MSEGYYASLNCKSTENGDVKSAVLENRQRVLTYFKHHPSHSNNSYHWVGLDQKHTSVVMFADKPFEKGPEADALVTTTPGLVLSIITADCVPVLLSDTKKPIIAAVHAGWKGTFAGVIANTLTLMRDKGATDIVAAIGPCIQQNAYEVGPEFYHYFKENASLSRKSSFDTFFRKNPAKEGHYFFNLPKLVAFMLQQENIKNIDTLPYNTFEDETLFFSYRRKTLRGEPSMGCQASCIMLR